VAQWSDIYPLVLPAAPGAADPALDQALRGAAREFYERTRIWRPWLAAITTVGTTRQYDLTLPAEANMVRIEQATLNGEPFAVLRADEAGVDLAAHEGPQTGVMALLSDLSKVVLARVLPPGSVLRLQVSVMPSEAATGVSDPDLAQYARGIAEGAKELLMLQPNRAWSNPAMASDARDRFERAMSKVAWRRHLGGASTVPRRRIKDC
jgi:hypothetical protein